MIVPGYEIKETIASSPRTVVWRATRVEDGRSVIIKSLASDYPSVQELRQLEFEYRILRKLDVPGVVRALGFHKSGNDAALILEDFGGRNIPLGPRGVGIGMFFTIAIQVAQTLGRIHERNVIHKDIKPRNLLIGPPDQSVKIIDFHVASELSRERQDVSAAHRLPGSLPYISPEQTGRMNRELDYRSDYYSLGVTLFELLTGRLPFYATDPMGWAHCHISKRPPRASDVNHDVPRMVADIVDKLLAKDPDERYQSAHGLIADLETCRDQWEALGTVNSFELAKHDVAEAFRIPQKLFGREREIAVLLEVFEEASRGSAKLLLVSGYSGVGKSSLVHEVHKPIVARKGYFVSGKSDQLERNVPYGSIVQALRQLTKQLLTESDDRLADWKRRLSAALGANGQVMIDIIPELQQIIGAQPPAAELNSTEAQNRFRHVFREFIKVFAKPDHPLVISLDDLQWMDASTPDLIVDLFANADIHHLMVIGAYRNTEIRDDHLLTSTLRTLKSSQPDAVREVSVGPLDEPSMNRLVAETLRSSEEATRPLTRLVFEKTEGNPFFTTELLSSLHRDGAFTFNATKGCWTWDDEKVRHAAVRDNVADLMVHRLRRLPDDVLAVLRTAACIGNQFDLRMLAMLSGRSAGEIAEALWEPISERIIIPLDGNYRFAYAAGGAEASPADLGAAYQFQHDRVQQAAYLMTDERTRGAIHLDAGRLLLKMSDEGQGDERIFDIVNHLNLAHALIVNPAERAQLSQLNLRAGQRAKRSTAYVIALQYLDKSHELASTVEGHVPREQRFELLKERAECVFLTGDIERATRLCDELLELASNRLEEGTVCLLRTRFVEHQGKLREAVAAIRAGLLSFGVTLPEDRAEIERRIGEGIAKMQAHLAKVPVEELVNLPAMTDPEKVMVMNLLYTVVAPAIQTYPPLFVLAELMMFDLALTHGAAAVSCKNFVDCAIIQGGTLGNYDIAYRLGLAAFKLLERYPVAGLEPAVQFVFGAFVSHWRAHYREGFDALVRAQRLGQDSGNIQHASYSSLHRLHRMFFVGRDLEECALENERALAYLNRLRTAGLLLGAQITVRGVARLTGSDPDIEAAERADEAAFKAIEAAKNAQYLYSFGQSHAMVNLVLGDLEGAERWQRVAETYLLAGNGLFSMADCYLVRALIVAKRWPSIPEHEREAALSTIKRSQVKLKEWADNSPQNFAHKYHLVTAEVGRILGEPLDVILRSYDETVSSAGDSFAHLVALAHELQAELWMERGQPKIAKIVMREAYQLYAQWGATAKLRLLEARYPDWFVTADGLEGSTAPSATTTTGTDHSFDLSSVLKATQVISSEVGTDRLFTTLMDTLIENAGAQRGCLVLKDDAGEHLYVEAWANVDPAQRNQEMSRAPLDEAKDVCPDIVRYVFRTHDTLVLNDAAGESNFQNDPYIRAEVVRSVLCMPILNQGALVAILYAENNAAARAFTSERLNVLRMIAAQAAISITNARLYNGLEQKVEQRTRELAQKNREVAAMFDGIEQGIFTIDEDLVILPQYSRHLAQILGTEVIAGQSCIPMLFRGSNVGPDALRAMEAALRFSFGAPSFLAEANVSHLVTEFRRTEDGGGVRDFEVDWNLILDENGEVARILVAIRDVTVMKNLKETAALKEREADIISQILDSGLGPFHDFCAHSRRLVAENRDILTREPVLSAVAVGALFRNLHTVKGDARLLGFTHLVDAVHGIEDAYDELRRESTAMPDRTSLLAGLDAVVAMIDEYDGVCRRKLAPLSQGQDARVMQALAEIQELIDRPRAAGAPPELLGELRSRLRRLRGVPLSELVRDTSRMFPSLARELKKAVPVVECEDGGAILSVEWAQVMRDVLVHSFRNALAHGIESSEDRQAAGKKAQGVIRLCAERRADGVHIRLADDGRGLALEALRSQMGTATDDDQRVAETIFASGVSTSTSVSRVSGRGVGMDVVRSAVRRKGGDVHVAFTGEGRAGYRPFELVVSLPGDAIVD